jgi:multisubunit Na+/H+ antiporter MnhE subunit
LTFDKNVRTIIGMKEKRTPGRPPVRDKAQNTRLYVRAIDAEKDLLEEAARRAQMSLSDWIRDRLVKTATKELKRYT